MRGGDVAARVEFENSSHVERGADIELRHMLVSIESHEPRPQFPVDPYPPETATRANPE